MSYKIITIERQFGSGGHEIGEILADRLGIPFYDNKLIEMAAEFGEVSADTFRHADEQRPGSLLYSIFEGTNARTGYHLPLEDAMYNLQSGVIRSLAEKESCILVGRCSGYVLKSRQDVLSVFIGADLDYRVSRIMKSEQLSEKDALSKIKKTDKTRSYYYNYYTDQKWGEITSYDVMLNSSLLGIQGCVDLLSSLFSAPVEQEK